MYKSPTTIREKIFICSIFWTFLFATTFIWNISRILNVQLFEEINLIHFVDTSQNASGTITSRQACAVESAALTNPEFTVHFHFTSKKRYNEIVKTSKLLIALKSYPNIIISHTDLKSISNGSPLEEFLNSGLLESSKYILEHTSDVARLLLLWKYGGTYFDTDVIVQKSLRDYPNNFVCQQDQFIVNGAILRVEDRKISEYLINDLNDYFDGDDFASNGPIVMTYVIMSLCGMKNLTELVGKSCEGFHLLPKKDCYEISYSEWNKFFESKYSDSVMQRTEHSLVIHFWNYLSKNQKLKKDSSSAYIKIATQFCPKVLSETWKYF